MNRLEVQDKGKGRHRDPKTGASVGPGASDKGVMREIRKAKRQEAIERNNTTLPERSRAYWKSLGWKRESDYRRATRDIDMSMNGALYRGVSPQVLAQLRAS